MPIYTFYPCSRYQCCNSARQSPSERASSLESHFSRVSSQTVACRACTDLLHVAVLADNLTGSHQAIGAMPLDGPAHGVAQQPQSFILPTHIPIPQYNNGLTSHDENMSSRSASPPSPAYPQGSQNGHHANNAMQTDESAAGSPDVAGHDDDFQMSPDEAARPDTDDDESEPVQRPGAHKKKKRNSKLDLGSDIDADLYGLRRSVSRCSALEGND